jgi:hypothetical protein
MIETKHICTICKEQFPENELDKAEEHAKLPINEGDYNLCVVELKVGEQYVFFTKGNEINSNHERMYDKSFFSNKYVPLCKEYGVENTNIRSVLSFNSISVSDIEECIKNKTYVSVPKEDLNIINKLVNTQKNLIQYVFNKNLEGENIFKTI